MAVELGFPFLPLSLLGWRCIFIAWLAYGQWAGGRHLEGPFELGHVQMLQLFVNMIMPQNLSASCCNFTGSDVLLIRISAKFDVDICDHFKLSSRWRPEGPCENNNSS